MNFILADLPGLIASALQLVVAGYALFLSWRYGSARVGWSLFSAFATLAMLHLFLSGNAVQPVLGMPVLANIIYGLTSVLLLTGLRHLELVLRRHRDSEKSIEEVRAFERQGREELEQQIIEQHRMLNRAEKELEATTARLKAEINERECQKAQAEKTHKEMLEASRQAGMSEVATAVLHNVGNVLNSVNVSATLVADHVAEFRVDNLTRAASLMRQHAANLGDFMTTDPKGRQLPEYLAKVASHLSLEQSLITREIGFVLTKIEHIKEIVATQQSYGKVMAVAENIRLQELVEDVLRIQAGDMSEHQVRVRREFAPRLPDVSVDKHKVLQILLNLLSNAKHACIESNEAERVVTVRVTNGDDKLRVAVTDNGIGIPANNLKSIFNHGFTTKKKGGHGFGLHGSALAAKEIGGAIAVHSDGPGRGATFTLELPLKRPSSHPQL